jgi:hypothetical protein
MLLKRLLTVKIASCPTFESAAEKVVELWRDAERPNPIRLEGFAGVGKSGLAKLLVKLVGGEHIAGDHFVSKFDAPPSYREGSGQGLWIAYQFVAPLDRKNPNADVFNVSLALTIGVLLLYGVQSLARAQDWSMFFADLFIVLWAILAWVCLKRFRETVDKLARPTRALLLITPIAIAVAYTVGVQDGYRDLGTPTELYVVETSKEKLKIGLLRRFDKGILVRNPLENTNQFMRWEEVRSISHDSAPDKGSRNLCSLYIWSWLAWLCH